MMRALRIIGSWWTTALVLALLGAGYFYFTFGDAPYAHFKHALMHSGLGVAAYLLLVANLVIATALAAHDRHRRLVPERIALEQMDAQGLIEGANMQHVVQWARGKGFYIEHEDASMAILRKGRMSYLPGTVFRAALVLFMLSALASVHMRETVEQVLVSGQGGVGEITATLPDDFLRVGDKDPLRVAHVQARVEVGGRAYELTNQHAQFIDGQYVRLTHVGYRVRATMGGVETALLLDVLPPGKSQSVADRVFTLEPIKTITKGLLKGSLYDTNSPQFRVHEKGASEGEHAVLRIGQPVLLAGQEVVVHEAGLYARATSVYDPAFMWMRAGYWLTLAGLVLMAGRFAWYEQVLVLKAGERGGVEACYREEFYRKYGVMKFYRWVDEIGQEIDKATV